MVMVNMIGLRKMRIAQHLIQQESGTLTQLRESIGRLHRSATSIVIQELQLVEVDGRGLFSYTQIAKSILQNALVEAAYMFVHTDGRLSREKLTALEASKQAFAFISGTGLEIMLEGYGLDYDADKIRTNFYEKFHIKDHS